MGKHRCSKKGGIRGGHMRAHRYKTRKLFTFLCRDCGEWFNIKDERFLKVFDKTTNKVNVEDDRLWEDCLLKRIRATEEDIV